jgi:hypothetical protein
MNWFGERITPVMLIEEYDYFMGCKDIEKDKDDKNEVPTTVFCSVI